MYTVVIPYGALLQFGSASILKVGLSVVNEMEYSHAPFLAFKETVAFKAQKKGDNKSTYLLVAELENCWTLLFWKGWNALSYLPNEDSFVCCECWGRGNLGGWTLIFERNLLWMNCRESNHSTR